MILMNFRIIISNYLFISVLERQTLYQRHMRYLLDFQLGMNDLDNTLRPFVIS